MPRAPPWPDPYKPEPRKMVPIFRVAKTIITDQQGVRRNAYFVSVNPEVVNPIARLDADGVVNEMVSIESINMATFPKIKKWESWRK